MKARFYKRTFQFKRPSGTSRGVLTEKHAWFIEIWNEDNPDIIGTGECSIIPGLSPDYKTDEQYEQKLISVCNDISQDLTGFPSIQFGLETALLDLKNGGKGIIFDNDFTNGKQKIAINGLIWMGDSGFMEEQIREKLNLGFDCLKLKIGTDWNSEKQILKKLRETFPSTQLELRVDANGGFSFEEAKTVLVELHELEIHSIEQPIKAGNWEEMHKLCSSAPTPIALDEELIGVVDYSEKKRLLEEILPQYIILKPSLIGGFSGSDEWISLAENMRIGWWITSALESNIGLNAIAQYTFSRNPKIPQGLGTGGLFTNNFETRLELLGDQLSIKKV